MTFEGRGSFSVTGTWTHPAEDVTLAMPLKESQQSALRHLKALFLTTWIIDVEFITLIRGMEYVPFSLAIASIDNHPLLQMRIDYGMGAEGLWEAIKDHAVYDVTDAKGSPLEKVPLP